MNKATAIAKADRAFAYLVKNTANASDPRYTGVFLQAVEHYKRMVNCIPTDE